MPDLAMPELEADSPLAVLRRVFGFPSFRGLQQQAVERITGGGDALVLMPTGAGKSVCYQVPALCRAGTAIVISPLIALMDDQVAAMRQLGVAAAALRRELDPQEHRRIGRELAPRLAAMEMHVIGVRRHPERPAPSCAEMHSPAALVGLLPRADWLILALPATPATDRLVGAEQLSLLPPHAVVVNLGRGPALDEAALAAALTAGRLAGAALDVFEHEPLAPDSPLWSAPGCLITPHVAAAVPDTWQRQTELVSAHLRRFLAGEPLEPLVDKQRGY